MNRTRRNAKLLFALAALVGFFVIQDPFGMVGRAEQNLTDIFTKTGLKVQIVSASVQPDRKPVVTFKITDTSGTPLDKDGLNTQGAVGLRFIVARIDKDQRQYTDYITRTVTGKVSGTVQQATNESNGKYTLNADGSYNYVFNAVLPEGFDQSVTHTIAIGGSRDMRDFNGLQYYADAVYSFLPAGGAVTTIRDIAKTEDCAKCHEQLAGHGGRWTKVESCVLCHTPQTVDPDTGNTVDFNVMIHKIHMGKELPSVQAGTPYQIIGNGGSVNDFSTVGFPRNILGCTSCHTGTQGDNWMTKLTRSSCGSCHDDVNWATGLNHASLKQTNDTKCTICHEPTSAEEFDLSVAGSHAIPSRSPQLGGIHFQIVNVSNTGPGQKPTVVFNVKDNKGVAIGPLTSLNSLRLTIAGPTTDFTGYWQEDVRSAAVGPDAEGNFTYTFVNNAIPADAKGTYAIEMEGTRTATLNPDDPDTRRTVTEAGLNVVKYVAVTDAQPAPRRTVVDEALCSNCHGTFGKDFLNHGSNRNTVESCTICHGPNKTDASRRNATQMPAETVDFRTMIHKIHRGEHLENPYVVYGFGESANNFGEIRFPTKLNTCQNCHKGSTNLLPLPASLQLVVTPRGYTNPTPPTAAACLACHDSPDAAAHALVNTASTGESCKVCHGEGATFAVSKVHAQ
ncbi:MAG: OmcA/MtrC family decaheme c-type cytochrome [Acidobacteria bacterium]|nr:OmcA/MtrC family decaheme c-type cytochrome [Acidobacteriota bacterium]